MYETRRGTETQTCIAWHSKKAQHSTNVSSFFLFLKTSTNKTRWTNKNVLYNYIITLTTLINIPITTEKLQKYRFFFYEKDCVEEYIENKI